VTTQTNTDTVISTIESTVSKISATSVLSEFSLVWSKFQSYHVDINGLLASLLTFQGILYLIDYMYRVLQSIQLVIAYWNRSVVKLPVINIQETRQWKNEINTMRYSLITWFMGFAPLIYLQFLLVVIGIMVIIWFLTGKWKYF
jgi:hypothetical protein